MTPRERMICALTGGTPDRVPAAPDMSYMIPCKKSGHSFREVLLDENPPLWRAYIQAIRYFGTDGWFTYGDIELKTRREYTVSSARGRDDRGRTVVEKIIHTPVGDLRCKRLYPEDDCDLLTEKLIKNFKEDFPKFRYLFPEITGYDDSLLRRQEKELGELGILCVNVTPPGMHVFNDYFQGNLQAVTYAYYDEPELFAELTELYARHTLRRCEMVLDAKPDSILTGGSGSITMQSPAIWEEITLPTLKEIIRMAHEAGVVSGIHSCGKEAYLVKRVAQETELNYVNPLEIPPMGDCELAEIKRDCGGKLALMGNLHTTDVMLCGSVRDVRRETLRALRAGAPGGGFVLSTGDQTPRDTPEENIFELLATVREFGAYPLDLDKIEDALHEMDNGERPAKKT